MNRNLLSQILPFNALRIYQRLRASKILLYYTLLMPLKKYRGGKGMPVRGKYPTNPNSEWHTSGRRNVLRVKIPKGQISGQRATVRIVSTDMA